MNARLLGNELKRTWCQARPSPTIVPSTENHPAALTPCFDATTAAADVSGGVFDDGNPIPDRGVAAGLLVYISEEDGRGADLGENVDRCVEVVGFLSADRRCTAVRIIRDLAVFHQVDHPDRAVVCGGGRREPHRVVAVDRSVARAP